MIIIWRSYGFTVPILFILVLIITQLVIELILGEHYYLEHTWPKILALSLISLSNEALYRILSAKFDKVLVDKKTKEEHVISGHFFFIPMQYWTYVWAGIALIASIYNIIIFCFD